MKSHASWLFPIMATVTFFLLTLIINNVYSQNYATIDPDHHPLIGRISPEIKGTTLNGRLFNLADHRGKTILVNFWSLRCVVCYKEIVELNIIADKYRDKNVIVISLLADSRFNALSRISTSGTFYKLNKAIMNNSDIHYEIIPDAGPILSTFEIKSFPMTVVIDKNGYVGGFSHGYRVSYGNETGENSENYKVLTQKIDKALKAD